MTDFYNFKIGESGDSIVPTPKGVYNEKLSESGDSIVPTPKGIYNEQLQPILPTPTFLPAAETYDETQSVQILCSESGVRIYYTIDGSTPDNTDTLYSSAITVSETTTIKAIAYKSKWFNSAVGSALFTISIGIGMEDDFTGDNGDPADATKWTTAIAGSNTIEIQNNKLRLNSAALNLYDDCYCSWIDPQDILVEGKDFDMTIDWEYISKAGDQYNYFNWTWLQVEASGVYFRMNFSAGYDDPYKIDAWTCNTDYSGGDNEYFYEDVEIGDIRGFRIKRVGATWSGYRQDSVGDWQLMMQSNIGTAEVTSIHFSLLAFYDPSALIVDFDNFLVV